MRSSPRTAVTGSESRRSTVYVDTSVFGRVILEEPDKTAIVRELTGFGRRIASRLLGIELRRLARREDASEQAEQILENVVLIPIDEAVVASAERISPITVATLDAIHLATAMRLAEMDKLDALMTYDKRLAQGAEEHGLAVLAPS
jgi:predicted nucleic acid-binding protein